jgi:hypothetical protein
MLSIMREEAEGGAGSAKGLVLEEDDPDGLTIVEARELRKQEVGRGGNRD